MQITTLEQLAKVEVNHTLFLINPFGMGDQSKVSINAFTVSKINKETFDGRSQFLTLDIDREGHEYFSTMLGRCKYVYTELSEANSKLDEIHKGLHAHTVKEHHDNCREMQHCFDRC